MNYVNFFKLNHFSRSIDTKVMECSHCQHEVAEKAELNFKEKREHFEDRKKNGLHTNSSIRTHVNKQFRRTPITADVDANFFMNTR